MTGIWLKFLVYFVVVGFARGQDDSDFCYYGHTPIPKSFYSHMIGWSCFEHVGYNAVDSEMYACVSDEGFKVPCLRNGNRYLDFSSQISRKSLLKVSLKAEELTKCIQKNLPCRITPTSDSMTRVWVPASVCDTEPRNKFHIAMLSISFIMGIPAFMFLIYFSWTDEKDITLLLHRNLICAITFRSLMTLLIQTEVILPHSEGSTQINREGIPALATFETLTLDLVLGFWMVQTMALWKIITNEHGIPLRVNIYTYASIGLSLSFTLIWIIVMASTQDLENWIGVRSWPQWLNEPLRIIFLIFQIGLICYSAKKIFWDAKSPLEKHDPKSSRRTRIETIYILILTPIFILQFCLSAGSPNGTECEEAFFYIFFFIDGIQGALVCLFFFYINSQVKNKFETLFGLDVKQTEPARPIRTLDSLRDGGQNDVVYSSVLDPERHAKTLQMYQKRNLIPTPSVTVVEGEEFVTCTERKLSVATPVEREEFITSTERKFSVATVVEGEKFMTCDERKISTATVFYDAVSLVEEPEPILEVPEFDFSQMVPQAKHSPQPPTPIMRSKYSSIGQSLSSSSSNTSSLESQPSFVRNDSTEAVRSSLPEDFKVTPRIMLTHPTIDRSSLEETPKYSEPKLGESNIYRAAEPNTTEVKLPIKEMLPTSHDLNIQYSSSDSDTSSTKEFRMRLNHELDEVLENMNATAKKPYVYDYQHEDSINSQEIGSADVDSDYSDDEKVPDDVLNMLFGKNEDLREHSGGDEDGSIRVVLRHSSETNHDILDERKRSESEYPEKSEEFDQSSSSRTSSVYSDDERVPESILNLLLSKKPDKTSDYSVEAVNIETTEANRSDNSVEPVNFETSEANPSDYSEDPIDFETTRENPSDYSAEPVEFETTGENTGDYSTLKRQNSTEIQNSSTESSDSEHSDHKNTKNFQHSTEPSDSEHSNHENTKNFQHLIENHNPEPDFENIPLPSTPENIRDPEPFQYSPITSGDRLETTTQPTHTQTLPRCSEPVAKPRPLSLSDERRTEFSNMFSKHQKKLLSSRSEDSADTKRTLRKFPGFDNLSSTEVFEKGSKTPTNKSDEDWLPQDVHFSDN